MLHGSLDGRGVWRRMDTCICMAESLCCPPETITIFLISYMKWKWKSLSCVQFFATPWTSSPWNSPQNTGVGSLSLLWGIFPTEESNPGLLHCRQIFYQLSHKESPRVLEWVTYLFSSGPSQPRNPTRIPCIAGRFFTNWAMRKALWTFVDKVMHLKIRQKDSLFFMFQVPLSFKHQIGYFVHTFPLYS